MVPVPRLTEHSTSPPASRNSTGWPATPPVTVEVSGTSVPTVAVAGAVTVETVVCTRPTVPVTGVEVDSRYPVEPR